MDAFFFLSAWAVFRSRWYPNGNIKTCKKVNLGILKRTLSFKTEAFDNNLIPVSWGVQRTDQRFPLWVRSQSLSVVTVWAKDQRTARKRGWMPATLLLSIASGWLLRPQLSKPDPKGTLVKQREVKNAGSNFLPARPIDGQGAPPSKWFLKTIIQQAEIVEMIRKTKIAWWWT